MNYFLAISLAAIGGCLIGMFAMANYYTYFDEADYWDDDEDLW